MRNLEREHIQRCIKAAMDGGHLHTEIEVVLQREDAEPIFCTGCACPLLDGVDIDGFLSVPHVHQAFLCETCEAGNPGHQQFHADIQAELDGRQVHAENDQERAAFHKIAQDEHTKCPWAQRGLFCHYTSPIEKG
jgi:hypothetical protein